MHYTHFPVSSFVLRRTYEYEYAQFNYFEKAYIAFHIGRLGIGSKTTDYNIVQARGKTLVYTAT